MKAIPAHVREHEAHAINSQQGPPTVTVQPGHMGCRCQGIPRGGCIPAAFGVPLVRVLESALGRCGLRLPSKQQQRLSISECPLIERNPRRIWRKQRLPRL